MWIKTDGGEWINTEWMCAFGIRKHADKFIVKAWEAGLQSEDAYKVYERDTMEDAQAALDALMFRLYNLKGA